MDPSIDIALRTKEKNDLYKAINDECGNIVEVFKPPMVGKSVLIQQVVGEIRFASESNGEHTVCYSFWCKNMYILQELIVEMIRVIDPSENHSPSRDMNQCYDLDYILNRIKNVVGRHVFLFHK
ncbi:hypothetical protein Btru_053838 [Bulinus truncatus]|nr:hypothetical protein Btru_053838 [Bulinus truncatus]